MKWIYSWFISLSPFCTYKTFHELGNNWWSISKTPVRIILWCPTTKMLIKACYLIQPLEQEGGCQKCCIALCSKVFINHFYQMKASSECFNTVETRYNTINFCWSTHKRHSIARPKGRGMGCVLWVQRATYCVDLSTLSSIKYLL